MSPAHAPAGSWWAARRKALVAALGGILTALQAAVADGLDATDLGPMVSALVTAVAVYVIPNATSGEPSLEESGEPPLG